MMSRRFSTALLAFALSACSQAQSGGTLTWPMYQNGTTHNAVLSSDFPAVSWSRDLHAKINGGLAYDGRYLYAVTFDHALVAIDPNDGTVKWRAQGDDVLMSTPIVAENNVYVGSGTNAVLFDKPSGTEWGRKDGNHLYAFRTGDGKEVWNYPTVGEAMPTAAYIAGQLLFVTGDDLATSVVAATGKATWTAGIPGVPMMTSVMVHDGYAFFATTQGKSMLNSPMRDHTLSLRVSDGKIRWSAPYGNSDCTPTVAQGLVFVTGVEDGPIGPREAWGTNDVTALDETTGAMRWHWRSAQGFFTAVGSNERGITGTYEAGVLYQPVSALSEVVAFDASTGRVLWTMHATAPVKMSPLVTGGKVYFGDNAGMFYSVDARTGRVVGAIAYDKPYTTSPPIIIGKTLFVANNDTIRALPLSGV